MAGLGVTVGVAYLIQGAVAIPSIIAKSDRVYDLSGSLTYLSCTVLSLYYPALRARSLASSRGLPLPPWPTLGNRGFIPRQIILSAFTAIWAARLGTYLFQRVLKSGGDSRFEEIKKSPLRFAGAFFAQATWVSLVALPVYAANSVVARRQPRLNWLDGIGIAIWALGFAFEIAADRQKSKWVEDKKNKKHNEDFLTSGLWGLSRHPNYFGESTLWVGIALLAARGAVKGPWGLGGGIAMCAISPIFTTFLLMKVSGVPLSEKKYDAKYGDREDYQRWKKNTPLYIPKLWKTSEKPDREAEDEGPLNNV